MEYNKIEHTLRAVGAALGVGCFLLGVTFLAAVFALVAGVVPVAACTIT